MAQAQRRDTSVAVLAQIVTISQSSSLSLLSNRAQSACPTLSATTRPITLVVQAIIPLNIPTLRYKTPLIRKPSLSLKDGFRLARDHNSFNSIFLLASAGATHLGTKEDVLRNLNILSLPAKGVLPKPKPC